MTLDHNNYGLLKEAARLVRLTVNLKNYIIFKKLETTQFYCNIFQEPTMLDQGENFYFRVRRTKVLAQNDFILYFFDALFAQENFALEVIISSLTRQVFFLISAQWDMLLFFVSLCTWIFPTS